MYSIIISDMEDLFHLVVLINEEEQDPLKPSSLETVASLTAMTKLVE